MKHLKPEYGANMNKTTLADKTRLMARLGGLPPGTRMIEYTHRYTKTYTNHYYKLIHDQDQVSVLGDDDDDQEVALHALIDQLTEEGRTELTTEDVDYGDANITPEAATLYEYLSDQQQESYDSYEINESFDGCELINNDVMYNARDPNHQRCVDDYIKRELDNTTQNKYGAQQ